MEAKGPAHSPT